MANSMLSNQKITLKSRIPISYDVGDTFTIFETWIEAVWASVVFSNKVQLERFQLDIATDGTCEIILRWLDNTEVKASVAWLKKDWDIWANGYITVLASDLFDKDSEIPQVLKAPFTFEWEVTFEEDIVMEKDLTVEWNFEVQWQSTPWPIVADETARDLLYPSPVAGNVVNVAWEIQKYNSWTAQWETLDVWTPLPDATEAIKGKIRIATDVEALAGTDDLTAMTPKKVNDLLIQEITESEAVLSNQDYLAWEDIADWDSLFREDMVTFASATNVLNIWDVVWNTRAYYCDISSWVYSSTFKASLKKFVSPSVNLNCRLQAWNWTDYIDVDATNAIATIAPWSLTTSLADTTMTWTGTFTAPVRWTKIRYVFYAGTYGSETINATNYYGIGYVSKHTSTRKMWTYNWTNRVDVDTTTQNNTIGWTGASELSWTVPNWFRMTWLNYSKLLYVTKNASSTATRAIVKTWWAVVATASFVWNVATFSTPIIINVWQIYIVEADASWASFTYTRKYRWGWNLTDVVYNIWTTNWVDQWDTYYFNFDSIQTERIVYNNNFIYLSSNLQEKILLSKACAELSYKLPDIPRISTENYTTWQLVKYDFKWITKTLSWQTRGNILYASNIPWKLSSIPWTNAFQMISVIDENSWLIVYNKRYRAITWLTISIDWYSASQFFKYSWTLIWSWWNHYSPSITRLEISYDNSSRTTIQNANLWNIPSYLAVPIPAWVWIRVWKSWGYSAFMTITWIVENVDF